MRFRLLVAVCAGLLVAGMFGAPAEAAAKPSQVGLVSVTGSSLYVSKGRPAAALRIAWPRARRATGYQVFVATTRSGVQRRSKPAVSVRATAATIGGLVRGRTYWIQVRATRGKSKGKRSARIARVTPTAAKSLDLRTHPAYDVMSYNVCSNACSRWTTRQPLVVNRVVAVRPDVLAVQEASRWTAQIPGYTALPWWTGTNNRLFFRTDRFELVTTTVEAGTHERCEAEDPEPEPEPTEPTPTTTDPLPTTEPTEPTEPPVQTCDLEIAGRVSTPSKETPWALLRDRASGQKVIFMGMHLLTGSGNSSANYRRGQLNTAFAGLREATAALGVDATSTPVVIAGDFNTNRSRSNNATTVSVLRANGFDDTYELARRVVRQHFNTGNPNWRSSPVIGVTWGDHVDKVWVRAARSTVHSWANVGAMAGSRYVTPLPSDHHPILVRVQVS